MYNQKKKFEKNRIEKQMLPINNKIHSEKNSGGGKIGWAKDGGGTGGV